MGTHSLSHPPPPSRLHHLTTFLCWKVTAGSCFLACAAGSQTHMDIVRYFKACVIQLFGSPVSVYFRFVRLLLCSLRAFVYLEALEATC